MRAPEVAQILGAPAAPPRELRAGGALLAPLAVKIICAGVVPALSTALALGYLVPSAGSGIPGFVAAVGHRSPLLLAGALFLVLSAVARYWLRRLEGAPADRTAPAGANGASGAREVASWVAVVAGAVCAALLFRTFVARPYRVEGPSMLPTFEPGDLVAGRATRGGSPRRGDVIVFPSESVVASRPGLLEANDLVKRVIGLPGDRVGMRGGTPVINGWAVPMCDAGDYLYVTEDGEHAVHGRLRVEFLAERAYLTVHGLGRPFQDTYLVKPGEVFVLGDDRGNSTDSRDYGGGRGGGVPQGAVEARVDRFVLGRHRSGDADFGRLLGSIDALQARVRLEGLETHALEEGIARCLANRPAVTRPPPAGSAL